MNTEEDLVFDEEQQEEATQISEEEQNEHQGKDEQSEDDTQEASDDEQQEEAQGNDDESNEESQAKFTQQDIDNIVAKRIAEERLRAAKAEKQAQQLDAQNRELGKKYESTQSVIKDLQESAEKDEFAPEEYRNKLAGAVKESSADEREQLPFNVIDPNTLQSAQIDNLKLEMKLNKDLGEEAQIIKAEMGLLVTEGKLPFDIVNLAVQHQNGAQALKQISENKELSSLLELAMYQEPEKFNLHFNTIADSLNNKVEEKPKSVNKPQPNQQMKSSAPTSKETGDFVYVD